MTETYSRPDFVGDLNDIEDVVRRTKMGRTTVFNLIKSGELKSIKIGARRLVSDKDLDAFIRSRAE